MFFYSCRAKKKGGLILFIIILWLCIPWPFRNILRLRLRIVRMILLVGILTLLGLLIRMVKYAPIMKNVVEFYLLVFGIKKELVIIFYPKKKLKLILISC